MKRLQRLDQAAVSRSKRRQFDVLLTVTAPHERIIFAATAGLMLALAAWAVFGRIEHHVVIDGVLIEPGDRHEVVSTEPGHLLKYFVSSGDQVTAGDPIARQSVPELDRDIYALQRQLDVIESGTVQGRQDSSSSPSHAEEIRIALLEMDARRTGRETIVTYQAGKIMALHSVPGEFISIGTPVAQIRSDPGIDAGSVQAVLRVTPGMAQRIRTGMQASVEVQLPGIGTQWLEGEVISVDAGPLPPWLAALPPTTAGTLQRIDIRLHEVPEGPVTNGTACRVHLVLGKSPPIALLANSLF